MDPKNNSFTQRCWQRIDQLRARSKKRALLRQLSGTGLEIGALHLPVVAPRLSIRYVDRLSRSELRDQYPELNDMPIIEPDIIDDGETLGTIADNSQDFVIASHLIEHLANPIAGLLNWQRVLKPEGRLFLVVPDKRYTFDRDRSLTEIDHLLEDYERPSRERDFAAYCDFALKVSCREFQLRPESQAKELARELFEQHYSIHYHVWDYPHFAAFIGWLEQEFKPWQMECLAAMPTCGGEFAFLLKKPLSGQADQPN